MEHSCAKCGVAVEDGRPFCGHCRAPQIRVLIEPSVTLPAPPAQGADSSDAGLPSPAFTPAIPHLPSSHIDWSVGLPCAAIAGFTSMLLVFIPLAACLLGGVFAVFLYRRRTAITLTPRMGARLGAATGAFGFLFPSVTTIAVLVYAPDKLREFLTVQISHSWSSADTIQQTIEGIKTPQGLTGAVITLLLASYVVYAIGASIGGAWYSAWLRRRDRG